MTQKTGQNRQWTLEMIKNKYKQDSADHVTPVFSDFVAEYFNEADPSDSLIQRVNALVDEYNSRVEYNAAGEDADTFEYKECLFELLGSLIPLMDINCRFYAYVNRCILSEGDNDQVSKNFYNMYFRKSVSEANTFLEKYWKASNQSVSIQDKDFDLFYRLGFMNFKVQNYKEAIELLEECRAIMKNKGQIPDSDLAMYSACLIYLANSYEYNDDLVSALACLLGIGCSRKECPEPKEPQKRVVSEAAEKSREENKQNEICLDLKIELKRLVQENENEIRTHIQSAYDRINKNTGNIRDAFRLCQYVCSADNQILRVFDHLHNNLEYLELAKSYVHVLSHCLSEYVSRLIIEEEADYPYFSNLQLISRALMDSLVAVDDSYVTCQATIRAENDACPEAIDLLLKHYKRQYESKNIELLSEEQKKGKAELEFYIFYFSEQELRFNYQDKKLKDVFYKFGNAFLEYSMNANGVGQPDFDSLFHYYVIQCKFLLKKYAKESLKQGLKQDYSDLDNSFMKLLDCRNRISKHVFESLTSEAERIENLYYMFRELRYTTQKVFLSKNLEEFERLCLCDSTMAKKNNSKRLLRVYDEIELRNKILILAPVYESPSCYFSVREIDRLIKFKGGKNENKDKTTSADVSNAFRSARRKHSKPYTKRKRLLSLENREKNIVKFAFYYDESQETNAFLYYKNFRDLDGNYSGEMFPLILKKSEIIEMKRLLTELNEKSEDYEAIQCGRHFDGVDLDSGKEGMLECFMKELKYDISMSDEVSRCILNLMIFLEMDFLSPDSENRIQNGDKVLWKYIDKENANRYCMMVFPEKYTIDPILACNWCKFSDIEEDNLAGKEPDNDEKSGAGTATEKKRAIRQPEEKTVEPKVKTTELFKCKRLNFDESRVNLEHARRDSESDSIISNSADQIESLMKDCETGERHCSDDEYEKDGVCPVIQCFLNAGIPYN